MTSNTDEIEDILNYEVEEDAFKEESVVNDNKTEKSEPDARSVYIGNVDYSSTAKHIEDHFKECGSILRITIPINKFTGHPKGFAYVEFTDEESMNNAMTMDNSELNGRQIQLMPKRTNIVGFSTTNRLPRGGFFRGRGRRVYARGCGESRGGGQSRSQARDDNGDKDWNQIEHRGRYQGRSRGQKRPHQSTKNTETRDLKTASIDGAAPTKKTKISD